MLAKLETSLRFLALTTGRASTLLLNPNDLFQVEIAKFSNLPCCLSTVRVRKALIELRAKLETSLRFLALTTGRASTLLLGLFKCTRKLFLSLEVRDSPL
jgi:hypothetical protein